MTKDEKKRILEKYGSELLGIESKLEEILVRFHHDEQQLSENVYRKDDCPIEYYTSSLELAKDDMSYAKSALNSTLAWISIAIEELGDYLED